ncbi:MAG: hypothetical protein LH471_04740, partial [Salinibacterium sp.]|nr:hypothetical protein [Salinibacterium sp.]
MQPAVKAVWDLIPSVIQDGIAAALNRAQGVEIPDPPVPPAGRQVRMYIGPTNYAGQGFQWARSVEVDPDVYAQSMVCQEINPFEYPTDYSVSWRTMMHSRHWQRQLLENLTANYTHVVFEAQMPVLGGMFGANIRRQVAALRSGGVTVGMLCHGTDIRLPSTHKERVAWSFFANDDWAPVAKVEEVVRKNMAILRDVHAPTFVSTPDLLIDVPSASWLPVVIDPDRWKYSTPPLLGERIRVVHVPSNPLPKGSVHIEPILRKLESEGLLEYVSMTGLTHDRMTELIHSADIVLDQFRTGDYGVGACEAMAAGRLVISHVSDDARGVVREHSGYDLPILEATIDSLEAVIRHVTEDRSAAMTLASQGPQFVRAVHDGTMSR